MKANIIETRILDANPLGWSRPRTWAIRIWYGLLSVWALLMAQGIVELALGQASADGRFQDATVTVLKLLAVGSVIVICATGGRSVVAVQALVVGLVSWSISELVWAVQPADASPLLSFLVSVAIWVGPVALLYPHRRELLKLRPHPSTILLCLAGVATVPLCVYAVEQGRLAIDPMGSGAARDAASLGIVLAAQTIFTALRPRSVRWPQRCIAVSAAWVAVAGILWPNDLGSLGRAWGAALFAWSLCYALAAERAATSSTAKHAT